MEFNQVSSDDNLMLCAKFEEEELREAVWECEGDKSPGLSKDVQKVAEEFYENGVWPRGSNASFIALVPKKESPHSLNE